MKDISLMAKMNAAVDKKIELVKVSPLRYVGRAILATILLTLATCIAFLVAEQLQNFFIAIMPATEANANTAYGVAKIFFSLIFGWALVMILFMNAELFTSNAMYFTGKVFDKYAKLSQASKVLILCFIGNFIGAILTSALLVFSKTFTADVSSFADHVVMAKLAKDPMTIFLQGIIANLVVNIAIILSLNLKGDSAKISAILFAVFMFAFFGSEHVIANFASFSLVGFATGFAGMSTASILTNFLFATLGNIVGGGLLIGILYVWLNKGSFQYKD